MIITWTPAEQIGAGLSLAQSWQGPASGAPGSLPVNTSPPTITTQRIVGQTITGSDGTWTGSPTFTYQWQRAEVVYDGGNVVEDAGEIVTEDWTDITLATSSTYTLVTADHRHLLRLEVTGTNGAGSAVAYSDPMTKIATIVGGGKSVISGGLTGVALNASDEEED